MKIIDVISEEELNNLFKNDYAFILEGFETETDSGEYIFYSYTFNFQHDRRIFRYRLGFRENKDKTKLEIFWKPFAAIQNEHYDHNRINVQNGPLSIQKEVERAENLIRRLIRKKLKEHPSYKLRMMLEQTKVIFNKQPL